MGTALSRRRCLYPAGSQSQAADVYDVVGIEADGIPILLDTQYNNDTAAWLVQEHRIPGWEDWAPGLVGRRDVHAVLMRNFFLERPGFTPMDAAALGEGAMKRLGVFGVEQNSARGAVRFLQTAKQVLADPNHMMWMNAPGRFADVRERPAPLAPGVTRLPEIAPDAVLVPLAFEYVHWTEKRGEALIAFGPPLEARALLEQGREARHGRRSAWLWRRIWTAWRRTRSVGKRNAFAWCWTDSAEWVEFMGPGNM